MFKNKQGLFLCEELLSLVLIFILITHILLGFIALQKRIKQIQEEEAMMQALIQTIRKRLNGEDIEWDERYEWMDDGNRICLTANQNGVRKTLCEVYEP
ncbi:MAG TPA: hypothetical protein VIK63_03150 [Haloplasmataceae bacterium]